MPGVIKQARVGAARFAAEPPHGGFHRGAIGVEDQVDIKTKAFERPGHIARIIKGVGKRRRVRIVRDSNNERNPVLFCRARRSTPKSQAEQKQQPWQCASRHVDHGLLDMLDMERTTDRWPWKCAVLYSGTADWAPAERMVVGRLSLKSPSLIASSPRRSSCVALSIDHD
jgi:hypothetical protein